MTLVPYYAGNAEDFVVNAIQPFLTIVKCKYDVKSFFFIRYWQKGFHIRLRIKCLEIDAKSIYEESEQYFTEYFIRNPSSFSNSDPSAQSKSSSTYYSNENIICDAIRFVDYIPEINRYGGTQHSILVAEECFQYSSDLAIQLFTSSKWNHSKTLANALIAHYILLFHFNTLSNDKCSFFYHLFKDNIGFLVDDTETGDVTLTNADIQGLEAIYRQAIDPQTPSLFNQCKQIYDTLQMRHTFEENYWNKWCVDSLNICKKLKSLFYNKHLDSIYYSQVDEKVDDGVILKALYPIISSYIHMTNNRLGVSTKEESYLAYIAYHCTKNLLAKEC
jgi:thiopeptide-type bacteriocin biosynthesis protein